MEDKFNFYYKVIKIFEDLPISIKIFSMTAFALFLIVIALVVYVFIYGIKEYYSSFFVRTRVSINGNPSNPSPIVYLYNNKLNPVYVAVLIDLTSKQLLPIKIKSFWADANIGNAVIRTNLIPLLKLGNLYWIKSSLKTCHPFRFLEGFIEEYVYNKTLRQGDTLSGWILVDFPKEKHNIPGKIKSITLSIEDSLGNIQKINLNPKSRPGESLISAATLDVDGSVVDLSEYK